MCDKDFEQDSGSAKVFNLPFSVLLSPLRMSLPIIFRLAKSSIPTIGSELNVNKPVPSLIEFVPCSTGLFPLSGIIPMVPLPEVPVAMFVRMDCITVLSVEVWLLVLVFGIAECLASRLNNGNSVSDRIVAVFAV